MSFKLLLSMIMPMMFATEVETFLHKAHENFENGRNKKQEELLKCKECYQRFLKCAVKQIQIDPNKPDFSECPSCSNFKVRVSAPEISSIFVSRTLSDSKRYMKFFGSIAPVNSDVINDENTLYAIYDEISNNDGKEEVAPYFKISFNILKNELIKQAEFNLIRGIDDNSIHQVDNIRNELVLLSARYSTILNLINERLTKLKAEGKVINIIENDPLLNKLIHQLNQSLILDESGFYYWGKPGEIDKKKLIDALLKDLEFSKKDLSNKENKQEVIRRPDFKVEVNFSK